jgi:hypothetical protein
VARYDAVIPALDALAPKSLEPASFGHGSRLIFTLSSDVPLYDAERTRPVARLAALDFLGLPTVVLGYPARADGWQLVLTPARQQLPSVAGVVPAQTYAWVHADTLPPAVEASSVVEISVLAQTLTIAGPGGVRIFHAGVGGASTPTPTGVTGYLQARYLDPAQGQASHPIQLTSLHATAADEPFGGTDGGLIGIHVGSGSSHGCIRLGSEALEAVNALPLGTPVRIV